MHAHNVQVLGFAVLVCNAVAVNTINNNDALEDIEDVSFSDLRDFDDRHNTTYEDIKVDIVVTRWMAIWLFIVVMATFIVEGILILIRFLNCGLVNLRITIFLSIVSCQVQCLELLLRARASCAASINGGLV